MYALLFAPAFVMSGYFDHIAVFFLVLGNFLAHKGRSRQAGLAIGAGMMVKIIPVVAIAAC